MKKLLELVLLLSISLASFAQKQTAPRTQGTWFNFPEQTAKNTLLASRFPSGWTLRPNRVLIQGFGWPTTTNVADGLRRFSNMGFTHGERAQFVNLINLPISKRFAMARDADAGSPYTIDGVTYAGGAAGDWARELPDSDPRKQHLINYGINNAVTSPDFTIYREVGRRVYYRVKGSGVALMGFDIETFAPNTPIEAQHNFQLQANLGMGDAIQQDSPNTKIFQYGGSLANVITYTKNRQDDDIYMRIPGTDWQGSGNKFDINASALAVYYRTSGAYVGRDQYQRRTWAKMSLMQKNSDGSIKFDGNGRPLLVVTPTGSMAVTNFGKTAYTTGYESRAFLEMWYEEADKILTDWCFLTNTNTNSYDGKFGTTGVPMPYPKGSWDRRPGLELINLNGWFRDDTESEGIYNPFSGVSEEAPNSNNRPLNPEAIRYACLMRGLLYHGNILWSDKSWLGYTQSQQFLKEGGGQYILQSPLAMGQYEHMVAGHYQASYFPNWFTLMDSGKLDFIIPKRFIKGGNLAVEEREENKPIVWFAKEKQGRQVYGVATFPLQDMFTSSQNLTMKVWVELDNGTKSGSYEILLKDRATFYDGWRLPAGFEGAKPENFRFQFISPITGLTFTWSGNFNMPFTGANPVPPATVQRQILTN